MYQYNPLNFSDQPVPRGQVSPLPVVVASGADVAAVEADVAALEAEVADKAVSRAKGRFLYG